MSQCFAKIQDDDFDKADRSPEEVLREIFSAFGHVQTCIVNVDKRHAFVKMLTRRDAMAAKDGMERYKASDMQLRVRPIQRHSYHCRSGKPADEARLDGESDLDLATAAIIRLASASSR